MSRHTHIDDLPVVDAKRPLRLTVSKNDCVRGDPKDPSQCALARAAKRELHVLEARVHLSRIYLRTNQHNWVRYVTPSRVRQEIVAFDRGGTFEPLTFDLKPAAAGERLGTPRRGGKATGTKPKRSYHVTKNVRTGPA